MINEQISSNARLVPWISLVDDGYVGDVAQQVAFVFLKCFVIFIRADNLIGKKKIT